MNLFLLKEFNMADDGAMGIAQRALSNITTLGSRVRPSNNMIGGMGDSRVDFGRFPNSGVIDPTQSYLTVRGIQFWAGTLSNAAVRFPPEYDTSLAGTTTYHLRYTQLPIAASNPCAAHVILDSTNDRTTINPVTGSLFTADESIANIAATLAGLLKAGKLVFLFAEMPRTGSTLPAQQRSYFMAVRDWIKRKAALLFPNVIVVDCWPDMANPAIDTIDSRTSPVVMRTSDNLHPGPAGGFYAGRALAAAISGVYPARDTTVSSNADQYSADFTGGCINVNPCMIGTLGTITAATGTVTGPVADNYQLNTSTAAGVTVTASKTTTTDGQRTGQTLTISGTPTSTNVDVILEQFGSTLLGRVSPGDVLELMVGVECPASVNLKSIMAQIRLAVGSSYTYVGAGQKDTGINFCAPEAWKGVMVTPRIVVPAGVTEVKFGMYTSGYTGSAITATPTFHNVALRKIV
jgi:hypothetical protein